MIVGKKLKSKDEVFILKRPLDSFIDVTGNVLELEEGVTKYGSEHFKLIANNLKENEGNGSDGSFDNSSQIELLEIEKLEAEKQIDKNEIKITEIHEQMIATEEDYSRRLEELTAGTDEWNQLYSEKKAAEAEFNSQILSLREQNEQLQERIEQIIYQIEFLQQESDYYRYNGQQKILYRYEVPQDVVYKNYTKIGLKANFRTLLGAQQVIRGHYGINLLITYKRPSIEEVDEDNATTVNQVDRGVYEFILDSDDMFGNPYAFEGFVPQEKMFEILESDIITGAYIYFYQLPGSFANHTGATIDPIPSYYNLLTKDDVYLCFGYDVNDFTEEKVTIYTTDSEKYTEELISSGGNIKHATLRWVHLYNEETKNEVGLPAQILDSSDDTIYDLTVKKQIEDLLTSKEAELRKLEKHKQINNTADQETKAALIRAYEKEYETVFNKDVFNGITLNKDSLEESYNDISESLIDTFNADIKKLEDSLIYHIRWYRYKLGASSADDYSGVDWIRYYPFKTILTEEEASDLLKHWVDFFTENNFDINITGNLTIDLAQIRSKFITDDACLTALANAQYELIYGDLENEVLKSSVKKEILNLFMDTFSPREFQMYMHLVNPTTNYTYWKRTVSEGSRHYYISFEPDTDEQKEEIKAIVYFNNKAYTSNTLTFSNRKEVPNKATIQKSLGLYIVCEDGTDGNYMIYNQSNYLIDDNEKNTIRYFRCKFDEEGSKSENEAAWLTAADSITWTIPVVNTMIVLEHVIYDNLNTEQEWWSGPEEERPTPIGDTDPEGNVTFITHLQYKRTNENKNSGNLDWLTQKYFIGDYYNPNRNINDTVRCEILRYEKTYKTQKELFFGNSGTAGTPYTLRLNIEDNKAALIARPGERIQVRASLRDNVTGQDIGLETADNVSIYWTWYGIGKDDINLTLNSIAIGAILDNDAANDGSLYIHEQSKAQGYRSRVSIGIPSEIVQINQDRLLDGTQLYILEAKVKGWQDYDLIERIPIPIRREDWLSYIDGPTKLVYLSDGHIEYAKAPYKMHYLNANRITDERWRIIPIFAQGDADIDNIKYTYKELDSTYYSPNRYYYEETLGNYKLAEEEEPVEDRVYYIRGVSFTTSEHYLPKLTNKFELIPLDFYVNELNLYGVQCYDGNTGLGYWVQPIYAMQNKYPSSMINAWDGKLKIDEENNAIFAARMAAGRKESDNTFTGVLMGDWGEYEPNEEGKEESADASLSQQTGVYGFHHGAMSFAFKEDGTAFIGKDGSGRIYFDGDKGLIQSSYWETTKFNAVGDVEDPESYWGVGMSLDINKGSIKMSKKGGYIEAGVDSETEFDNYMADPETPLYVYSDYEIYSEVAPEANITYYEPVDFRPVQISRKEFAPYHFYQKISTDRIVNEADKTRIENMIKDFETGKEPYAKYDYPTYKSEFDRLNAEFSAANKLREDLYEKYSVSLEQIAKINNTIARVNFLISELERINNELEELEKCKVLLDQLKASQESIENLEQLVLEYQTNRDKYEFGSEQYNHWDGLYGNVNASLISEKAKYQEYLQEIKDAGYEGFDLEEVNDEIDRLTSLKAQYEKEKEDTDTIEELENQIKTIQESEDYKNYESAVNNCTAIKTALTELNKNYKATIDAYNALKETLSEVISTTSITYEILSAPLDSFVNQDVYLPLSYRPITFTYIDGKWISQVYEYINAVLYEPNKYYYKDDNGEYQIDTSSTAKEILYYKNASIDYERYHFYTKVLDFKKADVEYDPTAMYYLPTRGQFITLSADAPTWPLAIGGSAVEGERKFRVNWDGTVYVVNGNFSGHIDATSGTLGDLQVTGTLTGGIIQGSEIYGAYIEGTDIEGGTIRGSTIYGADIYFGEGSGFKYNAYNSKEELVRTIIYSEDKGASFTSGGLTYRKVGKVSGTDKGHLGIVDGSDGIGSTSVLTLESDSGTDGALPIVIRSADRVLIRSTGEVAGVEWVMLQAGSKGNPDTTLHVKGGIERKITLTAQNIEFICDAENQKGIYARFA